MDKQNRNRFTDTEQKQAVATGKWHKGMNKIDEGDGEAETSSYKINKLQKYNLQHW